MKTRVPQVDDIISSIEKYWKPKLKDDCPFWTSLSSSYFKLDTEGYERGRNGKDKNHDEKVEVFYSEISFYPELIKFLAAHIQEPTKIEITFLSTLLPRHYWNFPSPQTILKEEEIHFLSIEKQFLNDYREAVKKSIENNLVKLERILIVSKESRFFFRSTHLFSDEEVEKDKKFCFSGKEPAIHKWAEIIKSPRCFPEKAQYYSSGCSHDSAFLWFTNTDRPIGPSIEILKRNLAERSFYLFKEGETKYNKESSLVSVYDFYVKNLHSQGGAKKLVLEKKSNHGSEKILPVNFDESGSDEFTLSEYFRPDLGLLTINKGEKDERHFILNAYMDLFNDVVKLEVIEEDEKPTSKYQQLIRDIKIIRNYSKPLSSNGETSSANAFSKLPKPV